jgi:hypothetical protein
MKKSVLWTAAFLLACSGPPAPDPALCEDVVIRLCLARSCPGVNEALAPGAACQDTLLERTGCGEDAFTFSTPSRERVLTCRQPLVRRDTSPGKAPTCQEVAEVQRDCPDVIEFLGGRQP